MATKWKKYSRTNLSKSISFILLIICLMAGVFSSLMIKLKVENYESITAKDYMQSNTLSNELRYVASRLEYVLRYYKSEKYIKEGGTVQYLSIKDSWQLTNLYNNFITENKYENNKESEALFWKEKSREIDEIKEIIKKSDLSNYQQIIDDLNNPSGLVYYASDSRNVCTNTDNDSREHYASMHTFLLIDDEGVILKPENGESTYSPSLVERFPAIESGSDETKIFIGITDEGLKTRTDKWNQDRNVLITNILITTICFIISMLCFVYLIIVAGRKVQDEELHFMFIDKLYTDLNLTVIVSIVALCIMKFNSVMNIRYINENLMKFAMMSSVCIFSTVFFGLFLSIVKHIKKGTAITYSLIYIVLSKLVSIAVMLFNSGPLMFKSMTGIVFLMVCTALSMKYPLMILAVLVLATYVVYIKVKSFKTIQDGIKVAKEGDYEFKINLEGNGEFKKLSEDINTITDGLKIAVQNKVKSEKFKTELITNVSHDIKTPLTSIISYVDLLKREGLKSPNAPKYLDVLDRKSNRLKILTEDLFEAAKVTSGSIQVNLQKVNINSLVSQVMGELDEKIQESQLDFKVSSTEEKIFANADGRLLSRVMENLLSNIFKYAQKQSRVYIDITSSEKEVSVCFKNVSANQLNIPVDELMERFKRGDESRNSEGNGLGLAIAKSLMELQKGVLELSIDGDLFKAEIVLNNWRTLE